MELKRIRNYAMAKVVSIGVRRYNGVHISAKQIRNTPHYAIMVDGRLAGWIGYRRDSRRLYEVNHLSIYPKYRLEGLAECATLLVLGIIWDKGCRVAYLRIKRSNKASKRLAKGMGFRRSSKGPVEIYSLEMKDRPVYMEENNIPQ